MGAHEFQPTSSGAFLLQLLSEKGVTAVQAKIVPDNARKPTRRNRGLVRRLSTTSENAKPCRWSRHESDSCLTQPARSQGKNNMAPRAPLSSSEREGYRGVAGSDIALLRLPGRPRTSGLSVPRPSKSSTNASWDNFDFSSTTKHSCGTSGGGNKNMKTQKLQSLLGSSLLVGTSESSFKPSKRSLGSGNKSTSRKSKGGKRLTVDTHTTLSLSGSSSSASSSSSAHARPAWSTVPTSHLSPVRRATSLSVLSKVSADSPEHLFSKISKQRELAPNGRIPAPPALALDVFHFG